MKFGARRQRYALVDKGGGKRAGLGSIWGTKKFACQVRSLNIVPGIPEQRIPDRILEHGLLEGAQLGSEEEVSNL